MAEPTNIRQLYLWYETQVNELRDSTSPEDARAVYIALQCLANSQAISSPVPSQWRGMIDQIRGMDKSDREELSSLVAAAVKQAFPNQATQEVGKEEAPQAAKVPSGAEEIPPEIVFDKLSDTEILYLLDFIDTPSKQTLAEVYPRLKPLIKVWYTEHLKPLAAHTELRKLLPYFCEPLLTPENLPLFAEWYDQLQHAVIPDILNAIQSCNFLSEEEKAEFLTHSPDEILSNLSLLSALLQAGYDMSLVAPILHKQSVGPHSLKDILPANFITSLAPLPLKGKAEAVRDYLQKNVISVNTLSCINLSLVCFPAELCLGDLEELYIRFNFIKVLPPKIGSLAKLCKLDAQSNRLKALPKEISGLAELNFLDLKENQLTTLPEEISTLGNLSFLIVSKNHLRSLPQGISNLTKLTVLYIDSNPITSFASLIEGLSNLTELRVDDFQFPLLPEAIRNRKGLSIENHWGEEYPKT